MTTTAGLPQGFTWESDSVGPQQWSAILRPFADANLYQTWEYGAVRWGAPRLSHLLLKRDGGVVACAQLAIFRAPVSSAGIAYLRWGPLLRLAGAAGVGTARAMAGALREEYAVRRRLLLRVVPHPLYEENRSPERLDRTYRGSGFAWVGGGHSYRTLLVDLSPSLEELRRRLAQKWRCDLNRAERNGLTVTGGTSLELYDRFAAIYREMCARKRFATSMDLDEFRALQQALPEGAKLRILVCEEGGEPAAAAIFSALGECGIYHLGATSTPGLKTKGSNLLQWRTIQWLKENGYRYYDLAGIDPERNPGGYHFKAGLGGEEICCHGYLESCTFFGSRLVAGVGGLLPGYARLKRAAGQLLRGRG
ncbi:lipid II:glycine glycyltransferase FemX [Geomesophilobacter sediminis]|uniref:Peptidoglycan bridge formation glycyltransferase FemA/FemB family protein n=1 Tax=Geomesophilobacter sediminis TaxID=2798584 RepID=A0A8J7IR88_9BACT|nr:GNAT family N-acetyltransferase [Geomesophilobacter sediminis]MBJ6725359.1 peptidoglycan bridge formation glycyltransferase FemA/FemB family protein [Geomesophilobacter sediminis]